MTERIQEFVDSRGHALRLDRERGVLAGVKLLGLRSRNGRTYRETALAEAAPLYEGAKVNVNHPKGHPAMPRDYQDRLGSIRQVEFRAGEGLFGNFHFNPRHALSEQLMWDAEHAPEQVGFSHNVLARTSQEGDQLVVEAITEVESVDLVADPATTQGLFEQQASSSPQNTKTLDQLTVVELQRFRPDLVDQVTSLLREQLDRTRHEAAEWQRQVRITQLLSQYHLPLPEAPDPAARRITSPAFCKALTEARNDEALEALIADRAAAIGCGTSLGQRAPVVSREQVSFADDTSSATVENAASFAAAVRR